MAITRLNGILYEVDIVKNIIKIITKKQIKTIKVTSLSSLNEIINHQIINPYSICIYDFEKINEGEKYELI